MLESHMDIAVGTSPLPSSNMSFSVADNERQRKIRLTEPVTSRPTLPLKSGLDMFIIPDVVDEHESSFTK